MDVFDVMYGVFCMCAGVALGFALAYVLDL